MKFDFGGYATKNDLRCSDGRIIRHGAFSDCDGKTVPLVWQHMHNAPENVLGHALLENREDGVYAYGTFNDSEHGANAKELVRHGDIVSLSIYANQLKQNGSDVLHGAIREVSLVLSGANPGALIDNLSFSHGDGSYEDVEDEAIIYSGEDLNLMHSEEKKDPDNSEDKKAEDEEKDNNEASPESEADNSENDQENKKKKEEDEDMGDTMEHADKTVQDVFDELTDEQKDVVYAIIGTALADDDDEEVEHFDESGDFLMHRNVFDNSDDPTEVLSHSDMEAIFDDAHRNGSLKDAVIAHGITDIEVLFPEAQALDGQPSTISRPMEWVTQVLGAVHKSPFSKVKSTAANITADEARARGYVKGTQKVEEVITALKRVVDATTIYKLQKLDRDDIIDITDFDVVAFLKQEMRTMLNEEIARAILVGDGRAVTSPDKIKEDKIIPVWNDVETYTTHQVVDASLTGSARAKAFIESAIRARKYYKGSGQPTLYVGTDLLTEMRLIRDDIGHRLYKNDQELADEMRVSKIVEIELLDGLMRDADGDTREFGGLIVNLSDYNLGANKGGEVTMFDDFDLDFNKYEYLIETRCSGALTKPLSAIALEFGTVTSGE